MDKIQFNSNDDSGIAAKLSYCKHVPYKIIESTGFGAYLIRRHSHITAPLLKYPTQALSPLPTSFLPCNPIDTPDLQYLNHSYAPLPQYLHNPFRI